MIVNLSVKRIEAFCRWGEKYIEWLESLKGEFKNNKLYDEEIARTRETIEMIQDRLRRETTMVPIEDLKL